MKTQKKIGKFPQQERQKSKNLKKTQKKIQKKYVFFVFLFFFVFFFAEKNVIFLVLLFEEISHRTELSNLQSTPFQSKGGVP